MYVEIDRYIQSPHYTLFKSWRSYYKVFLEIPFGIY